MFVDRSSVKSISLAVFVLFALQACSNSNESPKQKVEIQEAPKLTNDATVYANKAWELINQVDPILYQAQKDQILKHIQSQVREPVRQLVLDWRINVKMTDSVTEGKYALCRKALTTLDAWARGLVENEGQLVQKQANYERDKAQCKSAIEQPELGNTKAYTNLF